MLVTLDLDQLKNELPDFSPQITCCFTGRRDLPEDKINEISLFLEKNISQAALCGYKYFISGFARGTDILAAQAVINVQKQYPSIRIIAALPYWNRQYALSDLDCFKNSAAAYALCQSYVPQCYMQRNRFMVDSSSLVLAVTDGKSTGGTAYTIAYANKNKRKILCFEY